MWTKSKNELLYFLKRRSYVYSLFAILLLTYGYSLTHIAMGIDDFYRAYYTNGANYLGGGRFGTYLIMLLLGAKGHPSFAMEVSGVALLFISTLLTCVLFRRASQDKLPFGCYIVFSTLFVSAPINLSQWVYADTGFAIKVGYIFVVLAMLRIDSFLSSGNRKLLPLIMVFLTFAVSIYQSLAAVFMCYAGCYLALREITAEHSQEIKAHSRLIKDGLQMAVILVICILLQLFLAKLFQWFAGVETFDAGTQSISWFSGRRTIPERFIYVLEKIFTYYFLVGLFAPPMTLFCVSSFICMLFGLYSINKKRPFTIIALLAAAFSQFAIVFVRGNFIGYRVLQGIDCFIAFMFMMLMAWFYHISRKKIIPHLAFALCLILALFQAGFVESGYELDYLRWENEKTILHNVHTDLVANQDTGHLPVVFIASGNPYKEDYGFMDNKKAFPRFLNCSNARYDFFYGRFMFLPQSLDMYEYPYLLIPNAANAFGKYGDELFHIFDYLGYSDLLMPSEEQYAHGRLIADQMPSYPQIGYICETDDCIIVKLN